MTKLRPASDRRPVWLCALGIGLAFLAVFLFAAMNGYEAFSFANESIAYRWAHPSRVASGDVPPILPQGFTILAVQQAVVWTVEYFVPLTASSLRQSLQLFSWGTFAIFIAAFLLILGLVARNRKLDAAAVFLIFLPWLAAAYATGPAGWYYCLLPDYYHANALLGCAAVLALFPFTARLSDPTQPEPGIGRVALLGAVLGLGVANKVTWGAPVLVAAAVVALAAPRPASALIRTVFLGLTTTLVAGGVLFAYYRFQPKLVQQGALEWIVFMRGQQGETRMWSAEFRNQLAIYNYDLLYPLLLLTVGCVLALARGWRARLAAAAGTGGLLVLVWSITRRPAGTTLWDVLPLALAIAAALVLLLDRRWARRGLVALWLVAIPALFLRRPPTPTLDSIRASAGASENRFAVFGEVNRFAAGRPQTVMFVNNEYHHEGVHELLLKASAHFPTWHVTTGRAWLDHLAGNLTYYHEYGPPIVLPADLSSHCVVWFDRPDLPLLTTRYAPLAQIARDPDWEIISLPVYAANLASPPVVQIWVHAARRRTAAPFHSEFDQSSAPARVAPMP